MGGQLTIAIQQCRAVKIAPFFVSEATTTADNDKADEESAPDNQSGDNTEDIHAENTATVTLPENGAAVKFVSDGDVGTVDGTLAHNESTAVPSTSVDVVVNTTKTDKKENAKKEKPKVVGIFELVRFFRVYSFCQKSVY